MLTVKQPVSYGYKSAHDLPTPPSTSRPSPPMIYQEPRYRSTPNIPHGSSPHSTPMSAPHRGLPPPAALNLPPQPPPPSGHPSSSSSSSHHGHHSIHGHQSQHSQHSHQSHQGQQSHHSHHTQQSHQSHQGHQGHQSHQSHPSYPGQHGHPGHSHSQSQPQPPLQQQQPPPLPPPPSAPHPSADRAITAPSTSAPPSSGPSHHYEHPPPQNSSWGSLPAPPQHWQEGEESMKTWLQARAEEEKTKQEEEKTKQEELRLEQRRVEMDMLRSSLSGGIPPPMVPLVFASMGSGGILPQAALDYAQQFLQNPQAQFSQLISQGPHSPQHQREGQLTTTSGPGIYFPGSPTQAGRGLGHGASLGHIHGHHDSGPSIYFHHWQPPTTQTGAGGSRPSSPTGSSQVYRG